MPVNPFILDGLTPRHRFCIASHSKSFTAAGIMFLRDENSYGWMMNSVVTSLAWHPEIARATLSQVLSTVRVSYATGRTPDSSPQGVRS
jgi:CubicO group peptidase (beta-lactamase class C family)